jgi:eukaryotic-like serine/threonine-protein kinase
MADQRNERGNERGNERRGVVSPLADWEEIERLFHATVDLPADDRQALLASASAPVRAEVESLLKAEGEAFFAAPPAHLAADLVEHQPGALTAGQCVGKYEIDSLISIGGMGEVYRAHDTSGHDTSGIAPSGIPVALKILRRHLVASPHAVARFETEARATSALHHPNIVAVCESGESPAGMFIAMEWVEGRTFRETINAGAVDAAHAIDWGRQAARAVAAAHAAAILHRDIKPENIIIRTDGVLKVLDFGLARLAGPVRLEPNSAGASGTISGTLSGTLLYMSPEVLRGETASSSSDVFSLGALLYELWAGRHPFAGETPLDVYEAIECRLVAAPSTLRAGIPPEIDTLILRMLDRDPALRPSAGEVCDVLNKSSART